MSTTRIYSVWRKDDPLHPRLVRASNRAQALRHVADDTFRLTVAGQESLLDSIQRGVSVEDAGNAEPTKDDAADKADVEAMA